MHAFALSKLWGALGSLEDFSLFRQKRPSLQSKPEDRMCLGIRKPAAATESSAPPPGGSRRLTVTRILSNCENRGYF